MFALLLSCWLLLFLTNLDIRVTRHFGVVTAAIDVASDVCTDDGLDILLGLRRCRVVVNRDISLRILRTDIHIGVTNDLCGVTTTEDIVDSTNLTLGMRRESNIVTVNGYCLPLKPLSS